MEGRAPLVLTMAALTLPVLYLVNRIVPEPYMDEIFHIPQGRQYCNFRFKEWDPMITTFPGLYISSVAYKLLLYPLSPVADLCGTLTLRSINLVFSWVCALLFREILLELDPQKRPRLASAKALVLALYPLHWSFTSLYYTDVGSTAALMAMYLACLKDRYLLCGLFSCAAILFRQTNAVWTAFVLAVGVTRYLRKKQQLRVKDREQERQNQLKEQFVSVKLANGANGANGVNGTIKKRNGFLVKLEGNHIVRKSSIPNEEQDFFKEICGLVSEAWSSKREILSKFSPMVLPIIAFVMFVIYNGSIVLGDKSSHKAAPHFAQLMYAGAVSGLALAPFHFNTEKIATFFKFCRRSPVVASTLVLASFATVYCSVHYFSVQHKYLLADDRHGVYYIWKYIIQPYKYQLIPLYMYCWWSIFHSLAASKRVDWVWILAFCGAAVASLVPSPLMELRYYTTTFYLTALHILSGSQVSSRKLLLTALEFIAIDIVAMYLFLFRPWLRDYEPGNHRYIW